jgi:protein-tyrosine phosphatase
MKRVLFVCLGNICRSPAAAAVTKAKAVGRNINIEVDSAGTGDWHVGQGADARMLAAAAKRGYSLADHVARRVELDDFRRFDVMLAMDRQNQSDLLAMAPPGRRCDIRLFLDFSDMESPEAPDPYYGGERDFERLLDLFEAGAEGFLCHLEESGD